MTTNADLSPEIVKAMLDALTPEIVVRFREAIETGKWADGRSLSAEQRATCLQSVLIWESHHLPETERTGYIDRGAKRDGEQCDDSPSLDPNAERPLTWRS